MKKINLILLLLLFLIKGYCQYTVTKVVGTVKKHSTGEILKPGSSYNKGDKLIWSSKNDLVRTIIAGKGIFTISPSLKAQKSGSQLMEIVQFSLHLRSKEFNLSGRSENYELLPDALRTDGKINVKNLIGLENKYRFDIRTYDVSGGSRFFLQIDMPGRPPEIKRLATMEDTLTISLSDFYSGNTGLAKGTKYLLGFYTAGNHTSANVMEIIPYFDSTSQMETIIKLIVAKTKTDKDKIKQTCYSEVYHALGKPSDIIFDNIFNTIAASVK